MRFYPLDNQEQRGEIEFSTLSTDLIKIIKIT